MKYKKLSFIIPIWNEEQTLEELLHSVETAEIGDIDKEIILVNDGSTDGTANILKKYQGQKYYKVIHNERNMGKSQTVRHGITESTGDLVVIQDADMEYDPNDLKEFILLFQNDQADLVYGNRFGKRNKVIYWQNWLGNTALSMFSGLITGLRARMWTRDMEVCYKMARGDVFREIGAHIQSTSRFGLEPEMTARFSKYKLSGKHLRFKQVPISYSPRSIAEGKHMNAFRDGFKALVEIIRFNFLSR